MIGIFINLWNRLTGGGSAPAPALLDTYGGAAAAFSLRKLSSTYGGSAVRVRRSLDNSEQDIGFSGDNLDETALQAFVGYENLFARSEQFEDTAWLKIQSTITPNAGADPIGGNNAERWVNTGTSHYMSQNITLTVGQSYTISFWVKSNTVSSQTFRLFACSTTTSPDMTATTSWQRFSFTFVASSPIDHGIARSTTNAPVDLLIFGAQLNQGVTAQPYQQTIAANTANGFVTKWYTQDGNGQNLALFSQEFESGLWGKVSVTATANTITAPDGTLTADSISETAINSGHYIVNNSGYTLQNTPYTWSCYLKANQRIWGILGMYDGSTSMAALFNLQTGVAGIVSVGATSSIQSVGNGWYRCSITRTMGANSSNYVTIGVDTNGDGLPYLGVAGSGIYAWGAQLSQSSWLQGYQATQGAAVSRRDASQATAASQPRIVNAGVIERENGKPAIRFDGVDDNLLNSSTLSTTTSLSLFATFKKISHVNNAGIFSLIPSLVSPNNRDWASSNGRSFSAGVVPNGFNFIAHYIFGGSDGFTDYIDIKPNIALGSLISTSIFETGGLASVYTNGSVLLTDTYNGTPTAPTGLIIGARYDAGITGFGNVSTSDIVLYPTNLLPSRLAIESNVGSYYQTQWIGTQQALLDQFGGSAAAFSLRNLSSSYRGPLVRVRRSSDNAETDIGGTFSGDLDVNSLLAFTGGQNLLAYSDDFTNAAWSKSGATVTGNATIAPDGTLTADKIVETAVTGGHGVFVSSSLSLLSSPCTLSVYVKAAERTAFSAIIYNDTSPFPTFFTTFDLVNGQKTDRYALSGVLFSSIMQSVGNGWWRVSISGQTNKAGTNTILLIAEASYASPNSPYLGVAGSGVYVWGAQLTTGSVLQPYIPTTTAAINGANAFVTKWYTQDANYQNLVLQSQTFDNATWTKGSYTVSPNAIIAPDGTLTADLIQETVYTSTSASLNQVMSIPAGTNSFSVYIKPNNNARYFAVYFGSADRVQTTFDVVNKTFLSPFYSGSVSGLVSSYTEIDGYFKLVFTANFTNVVAGASFSIGVLATNTYLFFANQNSDNRSFYIWGAQVNQGELVPYTATTTAISQRRDAIQTTAASQPRIVNAGSVESENGKPSIFFDGTDDGLAFPSIDVDNGSYSAFIKNTPIDSTSAGAFLGSGSATGPLFGLFPANKFYVQTVGATDYYYEYTTHPTYVTQFLYSAFATQAGATTFVNSNQLPNVSPIPFAGSGNSFAAIAQYSSFRGKANIGEALLFTSNIVANRSTIESNINSYYQIYWQGNGTALLDSFSGASAAYSLRNLSSAYTGPLIRVRRSSDNAERDIYGTFRGDLDLAALTSFVGANSGFVTTWYDQSGIGDNLLLQSQTFEDASWVKFQSTTPINTTTAPDGTLTADTIIPNTTNSNHYIYQSISKATSSLVYTYSVYLKPAGYSSGGIGITNIDFTNAAAVSFDLTTLQTQQATGGTGFSVISSSIIDAGNGWYRVSVTVSTDSTSSIRTVVRVDNSYLNQTYAGNGTSGLYVWGAQLSTGSQLLRYQPTTTAAAPVRNAVQATAASQPRIVNAGAVDTQNGKPAMVFDGVNDSLDCSSQLPLINRSVFIVMKEVSRISDSGIFSLRPPVGSNDYNSTSAYEIQGQNTSANRQYGVFGSTSTTYYLEKLGAATIIPHVLISEIKGSSTANLYENSSLVASDNSFVEFDSLSFAGFTLSARFFNNSGQTLYGNNIFQEFIYMGVDQSASRVNIQSNINNYYKIY